MPEIKLKLTVADRVYEMHLDRPNGTSGVFHIMIDSRFYGMVVNSSQGWHVAWQNRNLYFSAEDNEIILDAVKNYLREQGEDP